MEFKFEIVWTRMARITYFEILANLEKHWTKKEIATFHNLTNENLLERFHTHSLTPIPKFRG
ncbi:hypothetical protein ACXYMT_03935 [Salinimicrobium sp. CAU 1759]